MGVLGALGGLLGASWALLKPLGGVLGCLGRILRRLGGVLGRLGASWGRLGVVLAAFWLEKASQHKPDLTWNGKRRSFHKLAMVAFGFDFVALRFAFETPFLLHLGGF